jgi:hypothetical protein
MDSRLEKVLQEWTDLCSQLRDKELVHFQLEGSEKHLYSNLYNQVLDCKNIKDRECSAYASREWIDFKMGLARSQAEVNHLRRLLEVKQKQADGEYLEVKKDIIAWQKGL